MFFWCGAYLWLWNNNCEVYKKSSLKGSEAAIPNKRFYPFGHRLSQADVTVKSITMKNTLI